jgi:hypothetical protein
VGDARAISSLYVKSRSLVKAYKVGSRDALSQGPSSAKVADLQATVEDATDARASSFEIR